MPERLTALAERHGAAGAGWLARLPGLIARFAREWEVKDLAPLEKGGSGAWVGGGVRDGVEVVLKLSWPHPEAATEADGLRFFAGRGAVELLDADQRAFALLVARCRPGDDLWSLAPDDAHEVAAGVLERLWRPADDNVGAIGSLKDTVATWNREPPASRRHCPPGLVADAARVGVDLVESTRSPVVVHGDFNPFNVLSAGQRWVAIDPKPLIGDPSYDLAQYLANWVDQAEAAGDPAVWFARVIDSFAGTLDLDAYRVAAWAFVKSVGWNWGPDVTELFRRLADDMG